MLKLIIVRSHMEVRNMFVETGGEVILVMEWQKAWRNCILLFYGKYIFWMIKLDI